MFTEDQDWLLNTLIRSNFHGAATFARNVKAQGFMTEKQYVALCNMQNSIRPWSSKSRRASSSCSWDHDDLAEGWDGI